MLFSFTAALYGAQAPSTKAVAKVIGEKYCEGDSDLFTVRLDLDVRVTNDSGSTVYLRSDMIPYVTRVASDVEAAKRGDYIYEVSGASVLFGGDQKLPDVRELTVRPGQTVVSRVAGGLTARYKPDFRYPQSVASGHYALQFVFKPEKDFPKLAHQSLESLTTEPVAVEIPQNVHAVPCR
jgi:hypothetical protein